MASIEYSFGIFTGSSAKGGARWVGFSMLYASLCSIKLCLSLLYAFLHFLNENLTQKKCSGAR